MSSEGLALITLCILFTFVAFGAINADFIFKQDSVKEVPCFDSNNNEIQDLVCNKEVLVLNTAGNVWLYSFFVVALLSCFFLARMVLKQ
jgi:hypothetical protein